MHPYQVINLIRETQGSNAKMQVLRENLYPELESCIHLALSSEYTFGIKKIPLYSVSKDMTPLTNFSFDMFLPLMKREITGNAAIAYLQNMLNSSSYFDQELIKMILEKKLDCGISIANANKVLKNRIPTFDVLLCAKQDQKLIDQLDWPNVIAQTKMDGMRVIVSIDDQSNVRYRTRNGKEFELPPEYNHYFSRFPGVVFDGEMLIASEDGYADRKTGNGLLNSIRQGKASEENANRVRFVFWDYINFQDYMSGHSMITYEKRYEMLSQINDVHKTHIWDIVKTEYVKTYEEAKAFYDKQRKDGQEGAILKDLNSAWDAKRVKYQIKMKAEETLDLKVVADIEGTGKYQGMLGAIICEDASGKLKVNIGSGFTDDDRKNFWETSIVGKIVEVKYNEIITNQSDDTLSLFLPIFVDVREDKNKADKV